MVRLCDNSTQNNQSYGESYSQSNYRYISCPHIAKIYSDGWRGKKKNSNEYLAVKKIMYKHNSYGYFHNEVDLPTPVSIHETCI